MEKQLLVDANIELTSDKLELIKKRADKTREEGWKKVKQQEIQIDDILSLPQIPNGTRFFIKPIGSNNHKIFDGDYSEKFQNNILRIDCQKLCVLEIYSLPTLLVQEKSSRFSK